jgi:RNA polymerase sigma-70 factor, ECF subfamily
VTDSGRPTESRPGTPVSVDFRTVFEREFAYVCASLRRLGVHERDLKDQTQDVFLTVHTLLADYDPSRPLRPWLFGIAYRFAARYRALARHTREIMSEELPETAAGADAAPGADERLAVLERQRLVLSAIESIELGRRAVFVMAEIDGHAMPEIAEALGLPLNTAYSRLRLAREEFGAAVRRLRARAGERGAP